MCWYWIAAPKIKNSLLPEHPTFSDSWMLCSLSNSMSHYIFFSLISSNTFQTFYKDLDLKKKLNKNLISNRTGKSCHFLGTNWCIMEKISKMPLRNSFTIQPSTKVRIVGHSDLEWNTLGRTIRTEYTFLESISSSWLISVRPAVNNCWLSLILCIYSRDMSDWFRFWKNLVKF